MTFRVRLLLTSMLALAVGLGAMVVIGNAVLRARADAEQTSLLRSRAQTQIAALAIRDGHVATRRTPVDRILEREAWVFDGTRLIERPADVDPAVDRAATALGRSAGRVVVRDTREDIALRAQPVRNHGRQVGAVVVGLSVTPIERLEGSVLLGSIVIAALLVLAGFLAIRGAVDGALRPVAAMTRDAAAWSAHDLDQRFDLGPRRDELTGLAATLDNLLGRIAASRRHEQRFASEVAHELRTPIARMRGRAELALRAGPGGDEERAGALASVVAEVDRLTRAIDALLAVARRETDPTAESVDLAAIAREAADGAMVVQAPRSCRAARATPRSCAGRSRRCWRTRTATRAAGSSSCSARRAAGCGWRCATTGRACRPRSVSGRSIPGSAGTGRTTTAGPGSGSRWRGGSRAPAGAT